MLFAGHCYRSKEEVISDLILWKTTHGSTEVSKSSKTYTKQSTKDTEYEFEDLYNVMSNMKIGRVGKL